MIGGTVGVILAYILYKKAFSMKVLTYIVCGVMVITAIKYVMDARAASKAGVA
jgi:predicted membrane channel-forming protein YqfA (hemolysin III family)